MKDLVLEDNGLNRRGFIKGAVAGSTLLAAGLPMGLEAETASAASGAYAELSNLPPGAIRPEGWLRLHMQSIFEKHKVSFVAVTRQFNTSTPLGRLALNILLSFAQFERELIGERTRDKMSTARRKGKWAGVRCSAMTWIQAAHSSW